ncbi:LexA family transcriptional regulator [Parabacteroides merdae]|uniref:LexA family transcriptional regulator n=1 Tax=Parabacteroides merdae TaxID=46503 RepID=UPI0022E81307|nr:S24 family peptidase [Parabacteroides merdae]
MDKKNMLEAIITHFADGNKSQLARILNISPQAISTWLSRGTFDQELIYAKCENINPDWLLTGRGSMLKSEGMPLMGDKKAEKEEVLPEVNYEYKGAPYYNVDFIGGFDLVLNDQTRNPDYYINFPPYNREGVVWCNITGHSMEPELNNGDFIAMKEMHSPIEYLPAGEIYGIITEDYRTVKRIRMADRDGFVRLIPTNKNPEYAEQEIPVEMIRKVYAVLGSMHRLF